MRRAGTGKGYYEALAATVSRERERGTGVGMRESDSGSGGPQDSRPRFPAENVDADPALAQRDVAIASSGLRWMSGTVTSGAG